MAELKRNDPTQLQPRERVLRHLKEAFFDVDAGGGDRLPTARELSQGLNVGISTVQKVYKQLIKEGHLSAVPGRGTFVAVPKTEKRIALSFGSVGDAATDLWQSRIAAAIIETAETMSESHEMVPFHPGDGDAGRASLVEKFSCCEGAILFPHPDLPALLETARKTNKPCVTLHPVEAHGTADFVSPDYINGCLAIGKALIASGRKRVALVQAHPSGESSISNFLRVAGLLHELGPRLGDSVDIRIIDAATATFQTGRETAAKLFAAGGFRPDFVFCMGDFLAHGFLNWLQDHDIACPDEVSLIAGSGLVHKPDPFPGMTCLHQPLEAIGQALLELLVRRIDARIPLPGVYVPHRFIGGKTTLPVENEALFGDAPQG